MTTPARPSRTPSNVPPKSSSTMPPDHIRRPASTCNRENVSPHPRGCGEGDWHEIGQRIGRPTYLVGFSRNRRELRGGLCTAGWPCFPARGTWGAPSRLHNCSARSPRFGRSRTTAQIHRNDLGSIIAGSHANRCLGSDSSALAKCLGSRRRSRRAGAPTR